MYKIQTSSCESLSQSKTQLLDDSSGYLCDAGVGNQLQCLDLTSLLTIFSVK